jgi:hypothetical protein
MPLPEAPRNDELQRVTEIACLQFRASNNLHSKDLRRVSHLFVRLSITTRAESDYL